MLWHWMLSKVPPQIGHTLRSSKTSPSGDHRLSETPHQLIGIAAEQEGEVRDHSLREALDLLQTILRRANDYHGPDEFLIEDVQALLRKSQQVMFEEAPVVLVRINVVMLHPAPEALDAMSERSRHLAVQTAGVDPVAEGDADRWADRHLGLD